jgi:hypothetical protein
MKYADLFKLLVPLLLVLTTYPSFAQNSGGGSLLVPRPRGEVVVSSNGGAPVDWMVQPTDPAQYLPKEVATPLPSTELVGLLSQFGMWLTGAVAGTALCGVFATCVAGDPGR